MRASLQSTRQNQPANDATVHIYKLIRPGITGMPMIGAALTSVLGLSQMSLRIIPVHLETANDFIRRLHRHNKPVVGAKFCIGVKNMKIISHDPDESLVGIAVVGRPIARLLDDGFTAEITRVCTDGTRNAASMLYGACRKAARAMGYDRIFTYTLPEEGGASLKGSSWTRTTLAAPRRCGTTATGAPLSQLAMI